MCFLFAKNLGAKLFDLQWGSGYKNRLNSNQIQVKFFGDKVGKKKGQSNGVKSQTSQEIRQRFVKKSQKSKN